MSTLKNILVNPLFDKNKIVISEFKENSNGKRISLFLGAGVSISAGLPQWNKLLAQVIGRLLYSFDNMGDSRDADIKQLYNTAYKNESSEFKKGYTGEYVDALKNTNLLELAEYILNYNLYNIESSSPYAKKGLGERQIAYLVFDCLRKTEDDLELFYKNNYSNSTIRAIVNCIKRRYKTKYQINKIITYNYDNLLEYFLVKDINKSKDMHCINKSDINSISFDSTDKNIYADKINICHIHGKINVMDINDITNHIILSESSYHDIEAKEYNWIHSMQANSLINDICLFIGFSGEDYNFRRIVRNCEKTNNCYILFNIDDLIDSVFKNIIDKEQEKSSQKRSDLIKNIFDNENIFCYEKLMLAFLVHSKSLYWENNGIKPIWCMRDKLPMLIDYLL